MSDAEYIMPSEPTILGLIERLSEADEVARAIQQPVNGFLKQRPGLRTLMHGTWLGHPVHSAMTDVPIGAWTSGLVLDLLDVLGIRRDVRQVSDLVHATGLAGALSAAVFGLADWSYTEGGARRVGLVHGLTNVTIAGLYAGSLVARWRGRRGTGIALSSVGYGLLLFSGWLGGELAFRYGIGVNHAAFEEGPDEWVSIVDEPAVQEGALRRAEADGTPVLLTRYRGHVYAIGDTCPHLGCSLSEGRLDGDVLTCRCHGSRFRVTDGHVVSGPAIVGVAAYDVRVAAGRIQARLAAAERQALLQAA